MTHDVLDDMPAESRDYLVGQIEQQLGIGRDAAEEIIRSSEPFWNAMENAGGLVDSWGGGEFVVVLPKLLEFIGSQGL